MLREDLRKDPVFITRLQRALKRPLWRVSEDVSKTTQKSLFVAKTLKRGDGSLAFRTRVPAALETQGAFMCINKLG